VEDGNLILPKGGGIVGVEDGVVKDVGVDVNVEVAVREGVLAINVLVGF